MNTAIDYTEFINRKSQLGTYDGFEPVFMPDFLFDFQKALVEWAIRKGRAAIFADCGTGKTAIQLVWADNVVRHTGGRVLILTPLAVSHQTVTEAEKFDIEARRSNAGELGEGIHITNYERLHYFNPNDFVGVVCDESSILKSFDGKRRGQITEFMKKLRYRLLCTATAAPNDYIELGTSSEALGELGHMDMLNRFFKNDQNVVKPVLYLHRGKNHEQLREGAKWRFKGHAEIPFWRWVASWARALRKPSDLGFSDDRFTLPPLLEHEHLVETEKRADGQLFALPAIGLKEQREERRRTIADRCDKVAELVSDTGKPALVWCHLNDEGDYLEKAIPDGVQVSGKDSDDSKESKFLDFARKNIRVLITKPKIGAWGLNFQHCSHVVFFPSHSFEQYYQGVRRCWRFGQQNPVRVDVVTSEGELGVIKNLQRKSQAADRMFDSLVREMNNANRIEAIHYEVKEEVPAWL